MLLSWWFETPSRSSWRHSNEIRTVWLCFVLLRIQRIIGMSCRVQISAWSSIDRPVCEWTFSLLETWFLRRPSSNPGHIRGRQLVSFRLRIPSLFQRIASYLSYKPHQIPQLKYFLSRLAVFFAQSNKSKMLSREWRCGWSSADRRCSNHVWVINNCIATKLRLIL